MIFTFGMEVFWDLQAYYYLQLGRYYSGDESNFHMKGPGSSSPSPGCVGTEEEALVSIRT